MAEFKKPKDPTASTAGGFISAENLIPFLTVLAQLSGYALSQLDIDAVTEGVERTDEDAGMGYKYTFYGRERFDFTLTRWDEGALVNFSLTAPERLLPQVSIAARIMQDYKLTVK